GGRALRFDARTGGEAAPARGALVDTTRGAARTIAAAPGTREENRPGLGGLRSTPVAELLPLKCSIASTAIGVVDTLTGEDAFMNVISIPGLSPLRSMRPLDVSTMALDGDQIAVEVDGRHYAVPRALMRRAARYTVDLMFQGDTDLLSNMGYDD